MIRLFTAIQIPTMMRAELVEMQHGIKDIHWVPPENFHITLRFIGNVDENILPDIVTVLNNVEVPAFELQLTGCDIFTHRSVASHLWIGVSENKLLHQLKEKIDHAFDAIKLDYVARKYIPHMTMAQTKHSPSEMVGQFLEHHNLYQSKIFLVENFTLYQSHLSKSGSIFEEIQSFPLKGGSQNRIDHVHS